MAKKKGGYNERDLLQTFTKEYEPEAWWGAFVSNSRLPLFTPRYVPDMMRNQKVKFGIKVIKSPVLALSRFYVKDDAAERGVTSPIKKFLIEQITRFWRHHAITALSAFEWGFHGSEALYRIHKDQIAFDALKPFREYDVRPITMHGKKVGVSVKNTKNRRGKTYLGGPKGFWHVHQREIHPWFGQSGLFGAFEPWIELQADGGAKDIRRLYYYKFAFRGDTLYYPDGDAPSMLAGPEGVGTSGVRSYKSMAREILSKMKSGGHVMFPNKKDESGDREWEIVGPQGGPGSVDILDYHEQLKEEIFEGMGIPMEVVAAAETGSGWSGRKVPQQGFYMSLQEMTNWLMFDFDQQILRELVRLNFGSEPDYEIIPFGLMQEDAAGEEESIANNKQAAAGGVPDEAVQESKFSIAV